jgi:superfamily II DNA or RNA helicase
MPLSDQPHRLAYTLRISRQAFTLTAAFNAVEIHERELKSMVSKLHPLDKAIVGEMRAATQFGNLSDQQLARILPLLFQRQTTYNGSRLKFVDEPLKPRLKISRIESQGIYVSLGLEGENYYALSDGKLIAGSQGFFLRGHDVYPIDSKTPWELSHFAIQESQLLSSSWLPAERQRWLETLLKAGVPASDIEALLLRQGPPTGFVLQFVEFKDETLRVKLYADYDGTRALVESGKQVGQYVVQDDAPSHQGMIERDWQSEEHARQILHEVGLRYERSDKSYVAKAENAFNVMRINWPHNWLVERLIDLPTLRPDLILSSEVQFQPNEGLLDVRVDIRTDDAQAEALIGMRDLLSWLHSGQKYLRLEDGSYVAPSEKFRKALLAYDDLGGDSERVLVSPLCIGILRALGDQAGLKAADALTREWLDELLHSEGPKPVTVPEELNGVLRDYQKHGLDWLMMLHRHNLTGILADDMGLGKTLQALVLLATVVHQEGKKMSLVVAPTSVVNVWRDECARFLPNFKVVLWYGAPSIRHALDIDNADLVITSYSILRRDAEFLAQKKFCYVILDEAQSAKNAASQNAQAVRQLKSEHRLALTGTPIENRIEELWATFDFLAPGFLSSLGKFRKRYGQDTPDSHFLLRERIRPLVLRRMKKDVVQELPPKIESVVRCDMLPAQRALYDHVAGTLRDSVLEKIQRVGIESAQLDILAALTRLRQICCDPSLLKGSDAMTAPPSAKLQLFEELMREALDSNRKIVVFSQFVQMQKRLIHVIKELGVNPLWLHGGTQNRDKVIAGFQDENGPPVIVVSLRAGGSGITLSRADTVMLYDPWWNPAVERQATDRAHRIGQKNQVSVYRLICAASIEERVVELAQKKDALAESLLGSEGIHNKRVTVDDVLALLR